METEIWRVVDETYKIYTENEQLKDDLLSIAIVKPRNTYTNPDAWDFEFYKIDLPMIKRLVKKNKKHSQSSL